MRRTALALIVLCSACAAPQPDGPPAPPADAAAATWRPVDAPSDDGRFTLRLGPRVGVTGISSFTGPCVELEARLLTDDPGVLFAGGPRASVLRPTESLAQGTFDALDEDTWAGVARVDGQTAWIDVPADAFDTRPVDLEVRCRLICVRTWDAHELGGLGPGSHPDTSAGPYELSVDCMPDEVIVGATTPGVARGGPTPEDGVVRLLTHAWAARAAEVRDAHGALLEPTSAGGTERGSVCAFEPRGGRRGETVSYPVTVRLRVPAEYDVAYPMFHWKGIVLPPAPGAGPPPDPLADLPPGHRAGDPEAPRRACAAALAATHPDAPPAQRVAAVLLHAGVPPLRERLTADAARGRAGAEAMLRALDEWRVADEAEVERLLAACAETHDTDRLVVGMLNAGNEVDAARIVDTIRETDPRAALPWLRLARELGRAMVGGGTESRLYRDDLLRSLDCALDAAMR